MLGIQINWNGRNEEFRPMIFQGISRAFLECQKCCGVEYLSPLKPPFLLGFMKSCILFASNFGVILKASEILTELYPIVISLYQHNDSI